MSSNNNKDKKIKPLSAISLCKTASKYATRAETADKASNLNKLNRTIDPESNTSFDPHIMLSDKPNMLAEDYNAINSRFCEILWAPVRMSRWRLCSGVDY